MCGVASVMCGVASVMCGERLWVADGSKSTCAGFGDGEAIGGGTAHVGGEEVDGDGGGVVHLEVCVTEVVGPPRSPGVETAVPHVRLLRVPRVAADHIHGGSGVVVGARGVGTWHHGLVEDREGAFLVVHMACEDNVNSVLVHERLEYFVRGVVGISGAVSWAMEVNHQPRSQRPCIRFVGGAKVGVKPGEHGGGAAVFDILGVNADNVGAADVE